MLSGKFYKGKNSGFTLPELLVAVSIIALLASVTMAAITKARDRAVVARLSTDFSEIKKTMEMYITQNMTEPCHVHNMSDTNEQSWSQGFMKTWPQSPSRTKYFFTHSGDQANPTSNDYYYIGVTLDPKYAVMYDAEFDDGNLNTGLFRSQTSPLPHYSYFLSYITSGSHLHCSP